MYNFLIVPKTRIFKVKTNNLLKINILNELNFRVRTIGKKNLTYCNFYNKNRVIRC
nr:MAG TPA: hypothetical protein [Herelleviridae sp.]